MKRGGDFRDTVYCFGEEEGETYTLCRWLRARKFDLAETIKMVEEATVVRSEPRKCNFFPGKSFSLLGLHFFERSSFLSFILDRPTISSFACFFKDGRVALGCSPSLFLAHYPQLYPGFAKNGCPLFISKP
jgi:hypothetical protein